MSRLFGSKLKRGEQDFYLQITSLIDTLVIILVFMLMTVGSNNVDLQPAADIALPTTSNGDELAGALKIIAKKDGIYVEETKVSPLNEAIAPTNTTAENGKKLVPLFQVLSGKAKESQAAAQKSGVKFEGKVLFQADKTIPLKTVKQVLYTSARAGYNDFKFAVVRQ